MESCHFLIEYHQEFRSALFISGFTIGSFLFSMKSVIVKTMKEEYYDLEEYQDAINQRISVGQNIGYYTHLKNFSFLLTSSIIMSFLSALSQISLGYVESCFSIIACLTIAFVSFSLVAISIFLVAKNWSKALDMAESRAINKNRNKIKQTNEK